ncbi:ABC transporter ATP-binding protein [Tepidamorphus sp. 3E244]|uniref:ABC transporter ATP-binding protein n=1 Tax=Tepidamorphus sp. 3E244 TaxID=3385498 RepID=UPI0038FD1B4B
MPLPARGQNLGIPAIETGDLHLRLGTGRAAVHVLRGIDLTVQAGQSIAILGPSGSGKSSLLMVMAGLERPTSGNVSLAGTALGPLNEDGLAALRGAQTGIVFQSFHLIPTMTALENVSVPLELAQAGGRLKDLDVRERAMAELDAVGLSARATHYPAELSGGEQQRVALARALVAQPQILFADEPTGNLDGSTGAQIVDLLFAAHRDRGTTLMLVTHDESLADKCDRVIRMADGEIISQTGAGQSDAPARAAS